LRLLDDAYKKREVILKRVIGTMGLAVLLLAGFSGLASAVQTIQVSDSPSRINVFDSDDNGVRMRVEIGAIDFMPVSTEKGDFLLPRISGFVKSNRIGEPCLPMANRLISIPFGCDLAVTVEDIVIEEFALADFGITTRIMPAQPSLSKSQQPEDVPFEFNDGRYETDAFYSLPQVGSEILGVMRSVRLGLISISPIEYNPVQNTLKICKEITIRVEYLNPDWALTNAKRQQHYSPFYAPIYDQVSNYGSMSADKDPITQYPIKYVIISDPMFEAQLQPFIAWKIKKGFNVETYYTDETGTSNTAIKNFIQNLYEAGTPGDPAPSFILFVGDAGEIPPFNGYAGSHITDLYFCEFTGDDYPEIFYGRFSAQTPELLQPQIDKTLEYERYEMPDPSYLDEVIMIAGVDGTYAPTHGNGQINYGTILYFNEAHNIYSHTWLYPASNGSGVNTQIINEINDGVCFANYTAHCGHDNWSDPYINVSNVNGFTNYNKYLLGIGNCCLSSTFADGTPCFGEAWMQHDGGGGIGYIGGSNSTYWDEDYWWGVGYGPVVGSGPSYEQVGLGVYDGLFHDHGEAVEDHYVTNAAISYCGNLAVSASTSSMKTYYWEIYHILGDPSVMTYLGVPLVNNVLHADALLMTEPTITVTADAASYVGISVDGVLHGAGYVDETGSVVINLSAFTQPCVADIVVTGQNRQPYMATIQVITPAGPYVIYNDDVIDDAGGNNNGLLDYGESIVLGMELRNVGPDTAYDVQAVLSTEDSYITITDASEFFGTIEGDNGTVYIPSAFGFDVAPSTPDNHNITFTATMTDVNDSVWASSFTLTCHAPVMEYVAVEIDDASGNNNGVLDPGETAEMVVTLKNTGSGQADDVSATLSESDVYVSVSDDGGTFGVLAASGGTGDNTGDVFAVAADASCPRGHEVTLQLDVSAINGFSAVLNFSVIVGDRVVFFSDDFSFDQGWTGLGGTGEWTIGPAIGGTGGDGYGGPDPDTDHSPTSDNGVLGNDLTSDGDYNGGMGSTYWVTSPVIDCGDFNGVLMNFYRWLGVESDNYDHAYLQAYDGSSWTTLFENFETYDESEWTEDGYDISAIADSNPTFQLRFGIGPTDNAWNYCGWNIDDLALKGYGERTSAEIAFDTEELADSLIPGDITEDTITIYNLSTEAILRVRFGPDVSWISCDGDQQFIDPESSQEFVITVNSTGMDPGDYTGNLTYICNDYSQQFDTIFMMLHLFAPEISILTTSIEATLRDGEQSSQELIIDNIGPGRLEYESGCQMFRGGKAPLAKPVTDREILGVRSADIGKSELSEEYYRPVDKGYGGPDVFGYLWGDSDEPGGPAYGWVDISSSGTQVMTLADDNFVGPLPLGFDFPFYENSYNELYIGSNGILTFGSGSGSRINTDLPVTSIPNNLIAMWWDDLDPPEGGSVYYHYDAGQERFIVSFVGVQNYISGGGTGSLTFQAILHPNGQVILQYATMDPGTDDDGLTGATIGIESDDGSDGLAVVCNAEYMHNDLAVSMNASRWLSVSPASGTVEPFSSDTIMVNFDAADLESGEYTGQVTLMCNDPGSPMSSIPVTLTVESFNCGDANSDGDVNVADAVMLINYIFKGGPAPESLEASDANGDGGVDVADAVYLINFVFSGGPPPIC
jgi:hypothetical protein